MYLLFAYISPFSNLNSEEDIFSRPFGCSLMQQQCKYMTFDCSTTTLQSTPSITNTIAWMEMGFQWKPKCCSLKWAGQSQASNATEFGFRGQMEAVTTHLQVGRILYPHKGLLPMYPWIMAVPLGHCKACYVGSLDGIHGLLDSVGHFWASWSWAVLCRSG
jgi:hypothetical protein